MASHDPLPKDCFLDCMILYLAEFCMQRETAFAALCEIPIVMRQGHGCLPCVGCLSSMAH